MTLRVAFLTAVGCFAYFVLASLAKHYIFDLSISAAMVDTIFAPVMSFFTCMLIYWFKGVK